MLYERVFCIEGDYRFRKLTNESHIAQRELPRTVRLIPLWKRTIITNLTKKSLQKFNR